MSVNGVSVFTVGQIADRLGVRVHRVLYALRSRGVSPLGRAGMANLYDEAAVHQVEAELRQIAQRRPPLPRPSAVSA